MLYINHVINVSIILVVGIDELQGFMGLIDMTTLYHHDLPRLEYTGKGHGTNFLMIII